MALINDHPLCYKSNNSVTKIYGYTTKPSTPCIAAKTGGPDILD